MGYPTTYPGEASDAEVMDLAGSSCPRLTSPSEVARRLAQLDEQYIRSCFVALDSLAASRRGGVAEARGRIAARQLPQPAYRLDDGTDMVAEDFFALADAATDLAALPDLFRSRYAAAADALELPTDDVQLDEQWADYLTGGYGVCLKQATPENIAAKTGYITALDQLLACPLPDARDWCDELRRAVDGLSAIERPGAILDPPRWRGPMSPQWYGTYLRATYPQAFAAADRDGKLLAAS